MAGSVRLCQVVDVAGIRWGFESLVIICKRCSIVQSYRCMYNRRTKNSSTDFSRVLYDVCSLDILKEEIMITKIV